MIFLAVSSVLFTNKVTCNHIRYFYNQVISNLTKLISNQSSVTDYFFKVTVATLHIIQILTMNLGIKTNVSGVYI